MKPEIRLTSKEVVYVDTLLKAREYQLKNALTYQFIRNTSLSRPIGYYLKTIDGKLVYLANLSTDEVEAMQGFIVGKVGGMVEGYQGLWSNIDNVLLTYGDWLTIIQSELRYRQY